MSDLIGGLAVGLLVLGASWWRMERRLRAADQKREAAEQLAREADRQREAAQERAAGLEASTVVERLQLLEQRVGAPPSQQTLRLAAQGWQPPSPPSPPSCTDCKHWDHEEGQAAMKAQHCFREVMGAVTPRQFGTRELDEDGNPVPGTEDIDHKTQWEDAGACRHLQMVVWPTEAPTCESYDPQPVAEPPKGAA